MRKGIFLLITFVTACLMTPPVHAEVRDGAFTVSPFVGGYTFDGVQHLKTNVASGLKLGYDLTSHWGVEGQFTYAPLKSTLPTATSKGDLFTLRGDVLYHFMPEGRFVPLVALGGGWSRTSNFFAKNGNEDGVLDYGAGAKYFLNDWLALRGDVRHIFSFHQHNNGGSDFWQNVEYTAGLTFQFGGVRAAAPAVKAGKPIEEVKTPALAPKTATSAPVTTPVAQPSPIPAPVLLTEQAPEPAPAGTLLPPSVERTVKPAAPRGKPVVTGITTSRDGVEILASEWIGDYRAFRLTQPARLVIDINGAINGLGTKKVPLNKLGFTTARVGTYPDHLRIVLDASGKSLPLYRIVETEKGLKVIVEAVPQKR